VFKNGCDTILLDTCITRNVDGVFNPVGYCSINYALMEVWGCALNASKRLHESR